MSTNPDTDPMLTDSLREPLPEPSPIPAIGPREPVTIRTVREGKNTLVDYDEVTALKHANAVLQADLEISQTRERHSREFAGKLECRIRGMKAQMRLFIRELKQMIDDPDPEEGLDHLNLELTATPIQMSASTNDTKKRPQ